MTKVGVLHKNPRISRRFWRNLISLRSMFADFTSPSAKKKSKIQVSLQADFQSSVVKKGHICLCSLCLSSGLSCFSITHQMKGSQKGFAHVPTSNRPPPHNKAVYCVVLMVPSMSATTQSPLLQCLGHPSSY